MIGFIQVFKHAEEQQVPLHVIIFSKVCNR